MKPLLLCAVVVTLSAPSAARADVVVDWNNHVFTAPTGPQIQRTLAMVHIAMFDAVNAIDTHYAPYLALPPAPSGASPVAAAAAAAHGVLVRLFPAKAPALAAALSASLAAVPDGAAETNGVLFGDLVAQTIYQTRLFDRILDSPPTYVFGSRPGDYQMTTPPGLPQPVNTGAALWIPFALESASQFRPNGPHRLTSPQYARDLEETRFYGGTANTRTADESQIAVWHTEQAQFQFNRIARTETAADGRSLIEHARLFALLNIALADATTAVFEAKYFFNAWRPSTAIHNADTDGNDRTTADPTWASFQVTPPHPEYPAAHGTVQGAAARVMKAYFGPHHAFTTTSPTVPGITRSYADFDAYAAEGFIARILGGMHFRSSLEEGARQGLRVGNYVLDHLLVPLED
jgi:hypothetical protein